MLCYGRSSMFFVVVRLCASAVYDLLVVACCLSFVSVCWLLSLIVVCIVFFVVVDAC